MATLQTWLDEYFTIGRVASAEARLAKLIAMDAPEIIIANERVLATAKHWQGYADRLIEKAKLADLANIELDAEPIRATGNGGKVFYKLTIAGQLVNFFPEGKFGAFLAKQQLADANGRPSSLIEFNKLCLQINIAKATKKQWSQWETDEDGLYAKQDEHIAWWRANGHKYGYNPIG